MQRSVSLHIPQRIDSTAHVYFDRRVQQTAECSNDSHHSCICIIPFMPAPRQLQHSRRSHALVSSLTAHCSLHVRTHCVGVRCLPAVDAAWRVHAWRIFCASLRCVGTWACAWGQESRGVVGLSGIARVLRLCVAGNCRLVRESVFLNTPNTLGRCCSIGLASSCLGGAQVYMPSSQALQAVGRVTAWLAVQRLAGGALPAHKSQEG